MHDKMIMLIQSINDIEVSFNRGIRLSLEIRRVSTESPTPLESLEQSMKIRIFKQKLNANGTYTILNFSGTSCTRRDNHNPIQCTHFDCSTVDALPPAATQHPTLPPSLSPIQSSVVKLTTKRTRAPTKRPTSQASTSK